MMAKDEAQALFCVGELEKLLRAEIRGRGAGWSSFWRCSMAEFPTALSAVTAAKRAGCDRGEQCMGRPAKRYAVRIGLNLGEWSCAGRHFQRHGQCGGPGPAFWLIRVASR